VPWKGNFPINPYAADDTSTAPFLQGVGFKLCDHWWPESKAARMQGLEQRPRDECQMPCQLAESTQPPLVPQMRTRELLGLKRVSKASTPS
jgi:hypothetical protein